MDIVEGHVNEAFNRNEELFEKRMKICKSCPLYKETPLGPVCNPNLYINEAGDVSTIRKHGYVKGCSCRLNYRCKSSNAHCMAGKW